MSERCHICGPVKHEALTVICAPCALEVDMCARCGKTPLAPGKSSDDLDVCDRCDSEIRSGLEDRAR